MLVNDLFIRIQIKMMIQHCSVSTVDVRVDLRGRAESNSGQVATSLPSSILGCFDDLPGLVNEQFAIENGHV